MFVDFEEELKINQIVLYEQKNNLKLWGMLAEQLKLFHIIMFM